VPSTPNSCRKQPDWDVRSNSGSAAYPKARGRGSCPWQGSWVQPGQWYGQELGLPGLRNAGNGKIIKESMVNRLLEQNILA